MTFFCGHGVEAIKPCKDCRREGLDLVDGLALLEVAGEHRFWFNRSTGKAYCQSSDGLCRWSFSKPGLNKETAEVVHREHQLAEYRARVGAGDGR